ncbi:WxL domain-containing protein [Enterococcus sp. LJL90]
MTVKSRIALSSLVLLLGMSIGIDRAEAASHSVNQNGSLEVQDSGVTNPVDPEFPGDDVDPGPGPSTDGALRFDFISSLGFGQHELTTEDRLYNSLAQLFHSETKARGYYVQITDVRAAATGWELQLSQDTQFNNGVIQEMDEQSLNGAVLSFDKGWANSGGISDEPSVTRDTIEIQEIGSAYTVASASSTQGKGTWTIEFGASEENQEGLANTLTAVLDETGQSVMDATFNKPVYTNSAIQLRVPESTRIYPVQYSTSLTWTLTAGPTN